jgi:SAM-dependent methyltransferase
MRERQVEAMYRARLDQRRNAHEALDFLYNEVAAGRGGRRENLDADHVSRYDSKEDAGSAEEVLFVTRLGLTPESVVVDIGAGTGQFACARVVAVDVSPLMLNALRAKVDQARLDNVEVVQAGFLTYEHQGSPADFVYSRYALHHLPDFWKGVAFARLRRTLRPGGLLRLWDVVYNFDPADAEDRIEAWCSTGNALDAGGRAERVTPTTAGRTTPPTAEGNTPNPAPLNQATPRPESRPGERQHPAASNQRKNPRPRKNQILTAWTGRGNGSASGERAGRFAGWWLLRCRAGHRRAPVSLLVCLITGRLGGVTQSEHPLLGDPRSTTRRNVHDEAPLHPPAARTFTITCKGCHGLSELRNSISNLSPGVSCATCSPIAAPGGSNTVT